MSTIITTATIMAMYLNAAGSASSQYAYNADIENGQVSTMYVMNKSGNSLSRKLKYTYTYDAAGRLTAKTASRYNSLTASMCRPSASTSAIRPTDMPLKDARGTAAARASTALTAAPNTVMK